MWRLRKTKMKKTLNLIYTLLLFSLTLISCGVSDGEKIDYNMGYERGKEAVESGDENNCHATLEYMAWKNMAGDQEDKKQKFCEGYEDGYNKKPNKYPEEKSK